VEPDYLVYGGHSTCHNYTVDGTEIS